MQKLRNGIGNEIAQQHVRTYVFNYLISFVSRTMDFGRKDNRKRRRGSSMGFCSLGVPSFLASVPFAAIDGWVREGTVWMDGWMDVGMYAEVGQKRKERKGLSALRGTHLARFFHAREEKPLWSARDRDSRAFVCMFKFYRHLTQTYCERLSSPVLLYNVVQRTSNRRLER